MTHFQFLQTKAVFNKPYTNTAWWITAQIKQRFLRLGLQLGVFLLPVDGKDDNLSQPFALTKG